MQDADDDRWRNLTGGYRKPLDPDAVRAILSVIAIAKDLRIHAKFLVEYTEDELLEIDSQNQNDQRDTPSNPTLRFAKEMGHPLSREG